MHNVSRVMLFQPVCQKEDEITSIRQRRWKHIHCVDRVLSHGIPISEQDDGSCTSLSDGSSASLSSSSGTRWSCSFGRVDATFQLISRSGCQLDLRPTERLSAEWSVQHSVRLISRSEHPKKKLDVNSRSFRRISHRPQNFKTMSTCATDGELASTMLSHHWIGGPHAKEDPMQEELRRKKEDQHASSQP